MSSKALRVNEQIRVPQVRVIADDGAQLGIMSTYDAIRLARERGVDLIEVSPTAAPPVCRLDDYGRLRYEQDKKDRETRKKSHKMELKEVKLRPKIEEHDYQTKFHTAERLLQDGDKLKVTIMFRGREISYSQHGRRLLDRMAQDTAPIAIVEREPRLEGRNMFMILSPKPEVVAAHSAAKAAHIAAEAAKHPKPVEVKNA
ncbi:MAG TPA: translation initiation factor IF-3 [Candidatus Eremiobacteraceae bacterium]|nr:translation initiation factor IF-3 [Candidatus Eremiobacteraceae bacterium]